MAEFLHVLCVRGVNRAVFDFPIALADGVPAAQRLAIPQRFPRVFAQVLQLEVAEAYLQPGLFAAVNLQRYEAAQRHRINQVRGGHAVDPGLERIAHALDAILVPLAELVGGTAGFVLFQRIEPAAPAFLVNAAAPPPGRLIVHLHLAAMHAARRNLERLAAEVVGRFVVKAMAADLNSRIQTRVRLQLQFEDEIAVLLFRAQKTVKRVHLARADDAAILDDVLRLAAALDPTVERLAVENG